MMRIIAGTARGTQLAVPSSGTRPTQDRVREAIFSALQARGATEDACVLDLFAGSGAYGFESLSRGALSLDLVDRQNDSKKPGFLSSFCRCETICTAGSFFLVVTAVRS